MPIDTIDPRVLRVFAPLESLKPDSLRALAQKTARERKPAGTVLFRVGENDKRTYYLESGSVDILDQDAPVYAVTGGTAEARNPLAPAQPRRFTARAATEVTYLVIDSDLLDVLLTWDQTGKYEVSELSPDTPLQTTDWMTALLQTRAFYRIPAANLQSVFTRMQPCSYRAGDMIIRQGDEGDYFYAISTGSCMVTRETPTSSEGIRLAELGPGETFGEEALIADARRNATVTMVTDGTLMRLEKHDFQQLLIEPMLDWIGYDAARTRVDEGAAQWLDVRLPSEFEAGHLPGAVNIPLYFLRLKLQQLDPARQYVAVCDTGRRSSAAAYILAERGFKASVLTGGLSSLEYFQVRK
jgi:CRP-like cAMP-binding protein